METTRRIRVLISGASIGGPALAYWLGRQGHDVTVIERSPALRPGGQAVDFKGATHHTVLSRMGILDEVRAMQTGGTDIPVVDADGRRITVMPGEMTGGDIEVLRGDLSRLLYERSADTCTYVFGDSIATMTETPKGVDVTFEHREPGTYDLVVGADGIHSIVRRLAFGPESDYVRHLGYYYALADVDTGGVHGMYNEPGRLVSVGGSKAPAMFVFASDPITYDRYDAEQQKRIVAAAFAGGGWQVPRLVAGLPDARDLYLDSISHVRMDGYDRGHAVLLGDAGYGNTLGGFGTGLAIVGAYVLAGEIEAELAKPDGDVCAALRRYTEVFLPYAKKIAGQGSAGRFLAPRTRRGIRMRNWIFQRRVMFAWMMWVTDRFATNIELRDYRLR